MRENRIAEEWRFRSGCGGLTGKPQQYLRPLAVRLIGLQFIQRDQLAAFDVELIPLILGAHIQEECPC